MSEATYKELLWHLLLRGADTFFLWCRAEENAKEVALLHGVWAEAQAYGRFLEEGTPVSFEVPSPPGPVISGLRLGDEVLVRRSDFGPAPEEAVTMRVGTRELAVPPRPGACQVLTLSDRDE
jgi:hypothetical protein